MNVLIIGSSSGIGFATVNKLKSVGTGDVYVTCRDKESLKNKLRGNHININDDNIFELDLENKDSIENFLKTFRGTCSDLDGVVLNAGYLGTANALLINEDELTKHFQINYFSQLKILKFLIRKYFLRKKASSVVAISSSAVKFANAARMAYSASKSAMETSMRILSREYGRKGIRFNCIAPGLVNTQLMRDTTPLEEVRQWENEVDLRKYGEADEIANAVWFLLSSESSYMTGQVMSLDGGR